MKVPKERLVLIFLLRGRGFMAKNSGDQKIKRLENKPNISSLAFLAGDGKSTS